MAIEYESCRNCGTRMDSRNESDIRGLCYSCFRNYEQEQSERQRDIEYRRREEDEANERERNDRERQQQRNDGYCFISTAALNVMGYSHDCEQLNTLREFRDKYIKNLTGVFN